MLTEDQRIIRDTVRSFSQKVLKPNSALWAGKSEFPEEALKKMAALGLYGMTVPEKWGDRIQIQFHLCLPWKK